MMANRRQRSYPDYVELGRLLFDAHERLSHGLVKASEMFPLNSKHVRSLEKIGNALNDLRSNIDTDYCEAFADRESAPGDPKFPMYPGPLKD
jgi:hypothetical protein